MRSIRISRHVCRYGRKALDAMLTFAKLSLSTRGTLRTAAAVAVALAALHAHADNLNPILGGGLGAVAGAVIGQSIGGQQGAVIGAAVGGAAGVTLANQSARHHEPERVVVYPQHARPAPVYGHTHVYGVRPQVVERVVYVRPHDHGRRGWDARGRGHGRGHDRDGDDRFGSRDDDRRGGDNGHWDRRD